MDNHAHTFTTEFAGHKLSIEVSSLAGQANAAVLARYGECAILATAVMSSQDKDIHYFPLLVDYEERFYAAGKILGSRFIRREARPSEEATLSARVIDRTIRPLFDHRIRRDIQVVTTVLATDEETDLDFLALLASSTALAISDIPWKGPVAGVKLLKKKDSRSYVLNPTYTQTHNDFEAVLFASGSNDLLNMIELEGRELAEDDAVAMLRAAQKEIAFLISWQNKIIAEIGKEKASLEFPTPPPALVSDARAFLKGKLQEAIYEKDKATMHDNLTALTQSLTEHLIEKGHDEETCAFVDHIIEEETDTLFHTNILEHSLRTDGRRLDEVRPLSAQVGLFARNHGSALFTRGTTQSFAATTLGPPSARQLVETIELSVKKRFWLHYNFPRYSVGETGPMRGPGRREIGHGALASKAVRNMLPDEESFPYTIRVVSEIFSSNGSSSMASVCAASLSLMDAGVPIAKPVAGIAMGLVDDGKGNYKILTDIQGLEDHYGDMDFKAAGTNDGLTALQMDVKIHGVTPSMLHEALQRARTARLTILAAMNAVLDAPRAHLSPYAPILLQISIPPEKIGGVIGSGGKVINGIIEKTGATSIDIEDDGKIVISADKKQAAEDALKIVQAITKTYEVGEVVEGEVVKMLEFGAIVQLDPYHDGMLHVSELKDGFVKTVEEVVTMGDRVRAKIIKVDPDGKIGLSLRRLKVSGQE